MESFTENRDDVSLEIHVVDGKQHRQTGSPSLRRERSFGSRLPDKSLFLDMATLKLLNSRSGESFGVTRPPNSIRSRKGTSKENGATSIQKLESVDETIKSMERVERFQPPRSSQKAKNLFNGVKKYYKSALNYSESNTEESPQYEERDVQDDKVQFDSSEARHTEHIRDDMTQHTSESRADQEAASIGRDGLSPTLEYLKSRFDAMSCRPQEETVDRNGNEEGLNTKKSMAKAFSDKNYIKLLRLSFLPENRHKQRIGDLTDSVRDAQSCSTGTETVDDPSIEFSLSTSLMIETESSHNPVTNNDCQKEATSIPTISSSENMRVDATKDIVLTNDSVKDGNSTDSLKFVKEKGNERGTESDYQSSIECNLSNGLEINSSSVPDEFEKQNTEDIPANTSSVNIHSSYSTKGLQFTASTEPSNKKAIDQSLESIELAQPCHLRNPTVTHTTPSLECRRPDKISMEGHGDQQEEDSVVTVTIVTENFLNNAEPGPRADTGTITEHRQISVLPQWSTDESIVETSPPPHLILERRRSGKNDVCISQNSESLEESKRAGCGTGVSRVLGVFESYSSSYWGNTCSLGDMFAQLRSHVHKRELSDDIKEIQSGNDDFWHDHGQTMESDQEEDVETNSSVRGSTDKPSVYEELHKNSLEIRIEQNGPRKEDKIEKNDEGKVCLKEGTDNVEVCCDGQGSVNDGETEGNTNKLSICNKVLQTGTDKRFINICPINRDKSNEEYRECCKSCVGKRVVNPIAVHKDNHLEAHGTIEEVNGFSYVRKDKQSSKAIDKKRRGAAGLLGGLLKRAFGSKKSVKENEKEMNTNLSKNGRTETNGEAEKEEERQLSEHCLKTVSTENRSDEPNGDCTGEGQEHSIGHSSGDDRPSCFTFSDSLFEGLSSDRSIHSQQSLSLEGGSVGRKIEHLEDKMERKHMSTDINEDDDVFYEETSIGAEDGDNSIDEDTDECDTVDADYPAGGSTVYDCMINKNAEYEKTENGDGDNEVSQLSRDNGKSEKSSSDMEEHDIRRSSRPSNQQTSLTMDESALSSKHPFQLSPPEVLFIGNDSNNLPDHSKQADDKTSQPDEILSNRSMDSVAVLAKTCFDPTFGIFGVPVNREVLCDVCDDVMIAPYDNDVKNNPTYKALRSCPCCKSKGRPFDDANVCKSCLLVLTFPTSSGNRAGRCPLCKAWIRITLCKSQRIDDDEDFQENLDGLKSDVEIRRISGSGHCLTCNQDKDILVEGKSTCDSCFLALNAPLLYECKQCHGIQRIPFPLYRYQKTITSFSTLSTRACSYLKEMRVPV